MEKIRFTQTDLIDNKDGSYSVDLNLKKINKLKDLQSVKPLVLDELEIEVIGFRRYDDKITINLKLTNAPTYANTIVNIWEFYGFNDDAVMYFSDEFYYRHEIQDMLESYIAERSGDYKIEKEG